MMLVSAENLLRICPKGVMSKNLKRDDITTLNSNCNFFLPALTFKRSRYPEKKEQQKKQQAQRQKSASLTGNSQVFRGDLCL